MGEKNVTGFPSREQALSDFWEAWQPGGGEELVSLDAACGRISARALYSSVELPVVRSSACDGIAVKSADFASGLPDTSTWRRGRDYIRADTGDDFDDAFDAVIMIEKAAIQPDGSVVLDEDVAVSAGTNVNPRGSTIRRGDLLVEARQLIRPTDLAALIMGGVVMVPVLRRPRVAFIPTGSELVPAGIRPWRGQNIDTNSLMVKHMLLEMGAEPLVYPIIPDNQELLAEVFGEAVAHCDIVVINGGSAVGDEDFNVRMIEERGRVIHHYIAAVPGRPMMLAVADGKPVIDLPGPTLAAYYGSDWCLRAVVARWLGVVPPARPTVEAYFAEDVGSVVHMANLARLNVVADGRGGYLAEPFNFKKGQLAQCLASNAQRVSPIGEASIAAGEPVVVEMLR
jgi:molybdopterin molybdotransferase/putative molybdopterin biosynthesis protein